MRQVYETIDRQSFQWIVVFVAGIGFFLDGYTVRTCKNESCTAYQYPHTIYHETEPGLTDAAVRQ